MIWITLAVMSLIAIGFAIRPMFKELPRLNLIAVSAIVLVGALSSGLYYVTGSPGAPSGAGSPAGPGGQGDIAEMVASLEERLERQPEDLKGWKMLGRTHMALGDFSAAAAAFKHAVDLESAQNAQTLVDYGAALAQAGGQQLTPEVVSVFENAIAIDPNHPDALFWAGIGAFNRGDSLLAADRWEKLLETDPPPEIRSILQQRISLWRGETTTPAIEPPPQPPAQPATPQGDSVVAASLSVSGVARESLPVDATVFLIARDPAQPSPPIAVARRLLSELPAVVELGDRESMIPGRELSGFAEFELIARVSVSGSPAARPGDWFGSIIVRPAEQRAIELSIGEQVQ